MPAPYSHYVLYQNSVPVVTDINYNTTYRRPVCIEWSLYNIKPLGMLVFWQIVCGNPHATTIQEQLQF